MMWDYVMEEVKRIITTDALLVELFDGAYRRAGPSDQKIPVIEWTLIADTESEIWSPMLVQFDCWTAKAEDARRAERRLRSLFHKTTSITHDTYTMFSEYDGGADLATPTRSGYVGRALRFRFSPLRQQYAHPGVA